MAIVYSYPLNKNIKLSDELVGTTEQMINGQLKTVTRNFLLQDLTEFFITDGGLQKTITLTTNNSSGPAILDDITGILNIPDYSEAIPPMPGLEQVLSVGNEAENSIILNSPGLGSTIYGAFSTTYIDSDDRSTTLFYKDGTYNSANLEFVLPSDKVDGRYTLATIDDIPAGSPITIVNDSSLFSTGLTGTGDGSDATNSIFLGDGAGFNATGTNNSNFFGNSAGHTATGAANSNFFGQEAGRDATSASSSNFLGYQTGQEATDANNSNFFGYQAGYEATVAERSNFIGDSAGYQATYASNSNFLGTLAGYGATNANNSNFFGYQAGKSFTDNNIGSNNIIIGTNISLPNATDNSINLGGILFGTGTYSDSGSENPSIIPTSGGKIGIGVVEPTNTLHIYSETEDTSGLRLERLTSASPTTAGQAIGVDVDGNVVTVEGGGGNQDLQSVTTNGSTTTDAIQFINPLDTNQKSNASYLGYSAIGEELNNSLSSTSMLNTGIRFYNSDIGSDTLHFNANLSTDDKSNWDYTNNYFIPKKPEGNYTLATLDDIPVVTDFVPYIGATADVNLGDYYLIANAARFDGSGSFGGHIALKQNGVTSAHDGYATLSSIGVNKLNIYYGEVAAYSTELDNSLLTESRLYKFPDASGTLALTSDIPSITGYVPYTGATTDVNLGLNDITATKLIKDGGFDYQFLKADGSVDNNTYLTSADLPSTLDLYATTSPDPVIPGYTALVRNITDSRYNTVAVNVPTPTITGTLASPTFCGAVISDPSVLLGNPGVFNFSVIGKIRRTGGSTSSGADFFFGIYKRNLAGVETLIANSAPVVVPANGGTYVEYISIALWNDGIFLSTDRVVLKFYGIKTGGGSGVAYEFLFGGSDPVRGTAAISSAIIPNIYLRDLADVEKIDALNNEVLYWNDPASLWEHSLAENLVPLATETQKGLVSTTTQTFAGDKTFTGEIGASNLSNTNTGDNATNTQYSGLATSKENALGNPSVNGYVLSSTTAGARTWIAQSGGGAIDDLDYLLVTSFRTLYNY